MNFCKLKNLPASLFTPAVTPKYVDFGMDDLNINHSLSNDFKQWFADVGLIPVMCVQFNRGKEFPTTFHRDYSKNPKLCAAINIELSGTGVQRYFELLPDATEQLIKVREHDEDYNSCDYKFSDLKFIEELTFEPATPYLVRVDVPHYVVSLTEFRSVISIRFVSRSTRDFLSWDETLDSLKEFIE